MKWLEKAFAELFSVPTLAATLGVGIGMFGWPRVSGSIGKLFSGFGLGSTAVVIATDVIGGLGALVLADSIGSEWGLAADAFVGVVALDAVAQSGLLDSLLPAQTSSGTGTGTSTSTSAGGAVLA